MSNRGTESLLEAPTPQAMCCICGEPIQGSRPLPIQVSLPDGATQQLWAHGACFAGVLHESVPFIPPGEADE